ncbi:MAG: hypothetical protein K9I84_12120 [Leadbetterella sp.]|nr:hypothetical protein [Leadbetterella sp.]
MEYKIDAKAHHLTNKNIWSAKSMNMHMDKHSPVYARIKKESTAYNSPKVCK